MSPVPHDSLGRAIYQDDRDHVFNSWAVQSAWDPVVVARADGVRIWDYDGNEYLDFCSQQVFSNVGYQHPRLVADLQTQVAKLATLGVNMANEARSAAAKAIADLFPNSHQKVFFTNGGADANENAMRMARLYTGRRKVLSFYRSYHGNTGAAIVATGDHRRWPNEFAEGHVHFFPPYTYRSAFAADTEAQECERALNHLRQVIELEGPTTIAAILIESMIGAGGVIPLPVGYLRGVRQLCDEYGLIYIADEVMVGFGRTGKMFTFQHDLPESITPDLVTFAKGVNSGYVPVGGVVISNVIADYFADKFYPGGLTYSGHPLACASIVSNLAVLHDEDLVANAAKIGTNVLGPGLRELAEQSDLVGEVRGRGLFWGVELVADKRTREPLAAYPGSSPPMAAISQKLIANGLLTIVLGNRIHLSPPLVINAAETEAGLSKLAASLQV